MNSTDSTDSTNSPVNFKDKYIAEGLDYLKSNWAHLSDWEKHFWHSVHERPAKVWTVTMYNKLHQIVEEAKGNIPRKRYQSSRPAESQAVSGGKPPTHPQ